MPESLREVRWVSETEGRLLYAVLGIPLFTVLIGVYSSASLSFPPGVKEYALYGLFPIFLLLPVWHYLCLTGPDMFRPAQVKAAAERLGLSFAARPADGETVLPPEFSLARLSAQWLWPRRRGPRNLIRAEVGGRTVWVFDIAWPWTVGKGMRRCETTAVYFPGPAPRLPDWPTDASLLMVERRDGRLLIYRPGYLCHPDSYPEFLASVGQLYEKITVAAGGGASQRAD